jgi:hypothetical protein
MLLYDAIQSYEDTLTITIYTGYSLVCPSFWGENMVFLCMMTMGKRPIRNMEKAIVYG